ncbi:MAG: hypothetical protein JXR51_02690 [Bacteroidales bacterium]|nr:hypothetical protein [Bacteroidales bacterium]
MPINNKNKEPNTSLVIKVIFNIILMVFLGFGLLILISPQSKALPIFLITLAISAFIIVLIALYINYAANMYNQIKK